MSIMTDKADMPAIKALARNSSLFSYFMFSKLVLASATPASAACL